MPLLLFTTTQVAKQIAKLPFTPGHECAGIIAAVGSDVPLEYQVGKRIGVENHYYCGNCYQCTHGLTTLYIIMLHNTYIIINFDFLTLFVCVLT